MEINKEKEIFSAGYKLIAGVDEAGRGPLAGPVVAACVVIDNTFVIDEELALVADSKKLSAKRREKLFSLIKERALAVEIGICSHELIDKINILQASFEAMRRALKRLDCQPDFVIVDGSFKIPKINQEQEAVIGGDHLVWTVAAASIIAKVSRDYMMAEYHKLYPQYDFAKHKGYGTKLHLEKIKEFGPCPIHRLSFRPIRK